jgi:hypothetical protein
MAKRKFCMSLAFANSLVIKTRQALLVVSLEEQSTLYPSLDTADVSGN